MSWCAVGWSHIYPVGQVGPDSCIRGHADRAIFQQLRHNRDAGANDASAADGSGNHYFLSQRRIEYWRRGTDPGGRDCFGGYCRDFRRLDRMGPVSPGVAVGSFGGRHLGRDRRLSESENECQRDSQYRDVESGGCATVFIADSGNFDRSTGSGVWNRSTANGAGSQLSFG